MRSKFAAFTELQIINFNHALDSEHNEIENRRLLSAARQYRFCACRSSAPRPIRCNSCHSIHRESLESEKASSQPTREMFEENVSVPGAQDRSLVRTESDLTVMTDRALAAQSTSNHIYEDAPTLEFVAESLGPYFCWLILSWTTFWTFSICRSKNLTVL